MKVTISLLRCIEVDGRGTAKLSHISSGQKKLSATLVEDVF